MDLPSIYHKYLPRLVRVASRCGQHPHKAVNLPLDITNMKNKLTDLCGNGLLYNAVCEINSLTFAQSRDFAVALVDQQLQVLAVIAA